MNRFILFFLCFVWVLAGCTEHKPRPEGSVSIVPLGILETTHSAIEVVSQTKNLVVDHHVSGQNIYVECFIPSFTFKEKGGTKVEGEGHMLIYVDGERVDEISTAAFIVKGLEKGKHQLVVEVVHNDSSPYNLKKSMDVYVK